MLNEPNESEEVVGLATAYLNYQNALRSIPINEKNAALEPLRAFEDVIASLNNFKDILDTQQPQVVQVPVGILSLFKISIQNCYDDAENCVIRIIDDMLKEGLSPLKKLPSAKNSNLLKNLINETSALYRNPANHSTLDTFSETLVEIEQAPVTLDTYLGRLMMALGCALLISAVPIALTSIHLLGACAGIFAFAFLFTGWILSKESERKMPLNPYKQAIAAAKEVEKKAGDLQGATGRYSLWRIPFLTPCRQDDATPIQYYQP